MPHRAAICRHSVAKCPVSTIKTLSPGDSVLTIAASQAPVPEDGKMITGPEVLKIFWLPSRTARPNLQIRRFGDRSRAYPSPAAHGRERGSAPESGGSGGLGARACCFFSAAVALY